MSIYSIALFLHIAGALGFFVVQGVEWIGLSQIRSTRRPEEAHAIIGVMKKTNQLAFVSIVTIVITGMYMMLTVWGGVPWLLVVLGALVLETVLFVVLSRPRVAAIEQALATEERPLAGTFHTRVNDPILWLSIQTRTAILLGIVFLKVAKPDLGGSLLAIGLAIILGLASAVPVLQRERVQARPAARIVVAVIATAFVAALVLLAAKSISASTIPLLGTQSPVQGAPTEHAEVPTAVGSSISSTEAPTPSPETALQEGQTILQTRCTRCHALDWLQGVKKTRAEWETILAKMAVNAKLSDAQKNALLDYLTVANQP